MANVYGNKGNRWWVGENIGETGSNQTVFGTPSIAALNPFTPSGYESLPSGDASDDAQFAAAAKTNRGSTKPNTISVENIEWFNIQGPFTTQATANAAIPAIQAANPSPGVVGQTQKDNANNPVGQALGTALTWEQVISALGDRNFWIRFLKGAIGGALIIVGVAHMTGADKAVGGVLEKATKAAPFLP